MNNNEAAAIDAELREREAKLGIVYKQGELQTDSGERTRYATPGAKSGNGFVRKCSEAQVRLIRRLLAERDTSTLTRLPGSADVTNVSKRGASDLIDRLTACPMRTVGQSADPQADPHYDVRHQVALMTDAQRVILERELPRRQTSHLAMGFQELLAGVKVRLADGRSIKRQTASQALDMLLAAPFLPRETVPASTTQVPDGRYALGTDTEGDPIRFYQVNTPTEGRWAGMTFVSVQASDDLHNVRNRAERERVLAEIAKDAQAAMLLYGAKIGRCGHCNRTLTNDESRARGIGPVCLGKMGW